MIGFLLKGEKNSSRSLKLYVIFLFMILNKYILKAGLKPLCNKSRITIQTKQIGKLNKINISEIYEIQINVTSVMDDDFLLNVNCCQQE